MKRSVLATAAWCVGLILALWLGVRYLLPVLLPFLLGGLLALGAEPAVRFAQKKLRLRRPMAAGVGVSLTLMLTVSLVWFFGALAVKELGNLASRIPDVKATVDRGVDLLRGWTLEQVNRLPEGARSFATGAAQEMFDSTPLLSGKLTGRLPALLKSVLGWLPGGALGIGTAVLAAFMLSVRLPELRSWVHSHLPARWHEVYMPALGRVKKDLAAWLKAQLKLSAVTYIIVAAGFLIMGVPYGLFWALPVAVVDAVPVLGTGTVLLPWALVELLQGQRLRALGLVLTYGAALLARTILEPKLVGKHLGLDPLLTLIALYAGYRLWGIPGMILAPVLTTALKGVFPKALAEG